MFFNSIIHTAILTITQREEAENMVILALYGSLVVILAFLWRKDPDKTRATFKSAGVAARKVAPMMLMIIAFIGILFAILPPDAISRALGAESGWRGTALAGAFGSITLLPGIVAFPLAGSLIDSGASVATAAVFITTLTMVGVVTLPAEAKELGWKMALIRNLAGLVFAAAIGLVMGAILG